jgi:ribosome-associated protein
MLSSIETALIAAGAADKKKGIDIIILDLRELTSIADYFVICSGASTTQVEAISDEVGRRLAEEHLRPSHIEGESESTWILLDYGDVVVHVFEEQTRAYYALDRLWGDAPRVPLLRSEPTLQGASG